MEAIKKLTIVFFICILFLSTLFSGFFLGYQYAQLKIEGKACPVSLKEGLNLLFQDSFSAGPVYYENYAFYPLKDGSIIVKKYNKRFTEGHSLQVKNKTKTRKRLLRLACKN